MSTREDKENLVLACKGQAEITMMVLEAIVSKSSKADELIAACKDKMAEVGRYLDAVKEEKQPVVVLLEDQGEIIDVVGPFDTPEIALTWSAYQQSEGISPVGMKFLVRGVSDPGPGVEPTCKKCDTLLDDRGYCTDETCPYESHRQDEALREG